MVYSLSNSKMTLATSHLYVDYNGGLKDINYTISKRHSDIRHVRDMDVLCGRGKLQCSHPGNKLFRKIVKASRRRYVSGITKSGRARIVRLVIEYFHTHNGRFLQKDDGSHHWIEMTDKQIRDKVAHAIRDAIKQDGSISRQFDFSGCRNGGHQLKQQVSVTNNNDGDKYNNILASKKCGIYEKVIKLDHLIVNESEDSSSSSSLSSKTTNTIETNYLNSHRFQSTYINKPQKSIYDYATADDCHSELRFEGTDNDDWFLNVIEWTLGSNETEVLNLQDVCYNNERQIL